MRARHSDEKLRWASDRGGQSTCVRDDGGAERELPLREQAGLVERRRGGSGRLSRRARRNYCRSAFLQGPEAPCRRGLAWVCPRIATTRRARQGWTSGHFVHHCTGRNQKLEKNRRILRRAAPAKAISEPSFGGFVVRNGKLSENASCTYRLMLPWWDEIVKPWHTERPYSTGI